MEAPTRYEQEGTVWLLLKGLYGLKQAGRIWHKRLKADMEELGCVQCQRDHAVFRIGDWGSPVGPCARSGSTTKREWDPVSN